MTIKEFSKLCNCTTQTLRYYDSIDLLKPAKVDPFTGYRYYDSEQAMAYVKIKNLQDAMFSIEEIKELLEKDDDELVKAFDIKIAEQKAKLEKIVMIQMSYRNDVMKMQEMIKKTQDKINESVGSYDVTKEYGISEEFYRAIIEEMNEQYENAINNADEDEFRFVNPDSDDIIPECVNPTDDKVNTIVIEESGWHNTGEVLKKLPSLDGEYILYFELDEEKWKYNDFCTIIVNIVRSQNKDSSTNITCTRSRSGDGQNHFWLLKR